MQHRGWVVLALALAMTSFAAPAAATIVEALSLSDLVHESDHVVLVECEGGEARYDARNRIVTDFTVRVLEVEKGSSSVGDRLLMRRIGGSIGDLGMRIEGEPHLATGQRYLLFLRSMGAGEPLRPVGMSQGVMPVQDSAPSSEVQPGPVVHPGGAGLTLRQTVSGGRLVPAPPALLHAEPLTAVQDRIRSIVAGQR